MTHYEFTSQIIPKLTEIWPTQTGELNSEHLNIWWIALQNFRYADVISAIRQHGANMPYFPKPVQIKDRCQGEKLSDRSGPRNTVNRAEIEAEYDRIACEIADDDETLANVSNETILAHRDKIVAEFPFMNFLAKSPASNRWVRSEVAQRIIDGGTVDVLPERGFKLQEAGGGAVSGTRGQGLLDAAREHK